MGRYFPGCSPLFQFTPLREGRLVYANALMAFDIEFQFTPLREGRLCEKASAKLRSYFNSRPSARGDRVRLQYRASGSTFQFTPLREGRLEAAEKKISQDGISIHAPPRGATPKMNRGSYLFYFNSRPSARGDTG